jgi:hypothetical protein
MNHSVLEIKPISNEETQLPQWNIKTKDIDSGLEKEEVFDAVMICNGYFLAAQ